MRKEVVWKWYHSIGLPLSYSRWDFQTNQCRPHPERDLKLLREPCFFYLQTIIVSQYGSGIVSGCDTVFTSNTYLQQRYCTSSPIFETTVTICAPSLIFSNNAKIPIVACKFTDFFIKLRHYTAIGKQLLFAKNRSRVAVIGLSEDGACAYLFENFRENSETYRTIPLSARLFSHCQYL